MSSASPAWRAAYLFAPLNPASSEDMPRRRTSVFSGKNSPPPAASARYFPSPATTATPAMSSMAPGTNSPLWKKKKGMMAGDRAARMIPRAQKAVACGVPVGSAMVLARLNAKSRSTARNPRPMMGADRFLNHSHILNS